MALSKVWTIKYCLLQTVIASFCFVTECELDFDDHSSLAPNDALCAQSISDSSSDEDCSSDEDSSSDESEEDSISPDQPEVIYSGSYI